MAIPDLVNVDFFSEIGRNLAQADDIADVLNLSGGGSIGQDLFAAETTIEAADILHLPAFRASDYGVIADGEPHNNVANLLDCLQACVNAGGGTVELPAGVIDTSEAVMNTVVVADSGAEYMNNGGLPLPPDCPITITGQGVALTTITLSPGFRRFSDLWNSPSVATSPNHGHLVAGSLPSSAVQKTYEKVTLEKFTLDRQNILGVDVAPPTAVTSNTTATNATWVTLPGIDVDDFKNADVVYFPSSNSGTMKDHFATARVNGDEFQIYNTNGTLTITAGDIVQGACFEHVLVGNLYRGIAVQDYFANGWDQSIDRMTLRDIDVVNVATTPSTDFTGKFANYVCNVSLNLQWVSFSDETYLTNFRAERVRMYGGSVGILLGGSLDTWMDECWMIDCFHDTMIDPGYAGTGLNFQIGGRRGLGRVGLVRCVGRRSFDVAREFDSCWEAHEIDCRWEEAPSGVLNRMSYPPARTADGPPTTTLATTISDSDYADVPIAAMPDTVARTGLIKIENELCWYKATNAAGTTITLSRGVNGTTAAHHSSGVTVTFVEVEKTRVYTSGTTIDQKDVTGTSTWTGEVFLSLEDSKKLPQSPWSIRDCVVNISGGDLHYDNLGSAVRWSGWQMGLDIQGCQFNYHDISHAGTDNKIGGVIGGTAPDTTALYDDSVPCPPPRIYGRNNIIRVSGAFVNTSNGCVMSTLLVGAGYYLLDFDFDSEMSMFNADSDGIVFAHLDSSDLVIAAGSRLGITARHRSGIGSASAPLAVQVGSTSSVTIADILEVRADVAQMSTASSPWSIDATQCNKVKHRYGVAEYFVPRDYEYAGWSFDPVCIAAAGNFPSTGSLFLAAVKIPVPTTISNLYVNVQAAGVSMTSGQNFAGLYDTSRNLLSATADQSTAWESAGLKTMALTTPQNVAAGIYYVGFYVNGSTRPKFSVAVGVASENISAYNTGITGGAYRSGIANSSLTTALPNPCSTINPVNNAVWWAAVG